jgi:hypothetical protein
VTTSIEARVARSQLRLDSFAHLTQAPLLQITPNGLLFDDELTDAQVFAVWWFATSTSDADQAFRESVALKIVEAETKPQNETTKWLTAAYAELARYVVKYGTEATP